MPNIFQLHVKWEKKNKSFYGFNRLILHQTEELRIFKSYNCYKLKIIFTC